MSLARLRGLLLPRLPVRPARPGRGLAQPVGGDQAPRGVDPGQGGGPHRGARHRPDAERRRAARSSPPTGATTCPTASSSPARSRTRSNGEVTFSYPAVYGGREVAGVKLRFEDGKVVDASAERNEEFLLKTLDTDEGARRLGELGHRHQLRDRPLHQGDPAGREDRRHDPSRGRHVLSGDRRHEQLRRPLGHGLRPAPGRPDHGRRPGAAGRRQVLASRPPPGVRGGA